MDPKHVEVFVREKDFRRSNMDRRTYIKQNFGGFFFGNEDVFNVFMDRKRFEARRPLESLFRIDFFNFSCMDRRPLENHLRYLFGRTN